MKSSLVQNLPRPQGDRVEASRNPDIPGNNVRSGAIPGSFNGRTFVFGTSCASSILAPGAMSTYKTIEDVQDLGRICGFSLTTDEAWSILWNRTAYPFDDEQGTMSHFVRYLNAVRTNGPFDCVRCGADVAAISDYCPECRIILDT